MCKGHMPNTSLYALSRGGLRFVRRGAFCPHWQHLHPILTFPRQGGRRESLEKNLCLSTEFVISRTALILRTA